MWNLLPKHIPRTIPLSRTFSQYVEDNNSLLSGVGIIATVAALFLNIDASAFDGIKPLQLFLLLFLALSLVFVIINTFTWFIKKADSVFASLVTLTLAMSLYQLCFFILHNFTEELKSYLALISFGVMYFIWTFLKDFEKKFEQNIEKSSSKYKVIFNGLLLFAFLYLWIVGTDVFRHFSRDLSVDWHDFTRPLRNVLIITVPLWVIIVEVAMEYAPSMRRYPYFWATFLFLPLMGFVFYGVIYVYYFFKTASVSFL